MKHLYNSSLLKIFSDILLTKLVFVLHEHFAFSIISLYSTKLQFSSQIVKLLSIKFFFLADKVKSVPFSEVKVLHISL